MTLDEFRAICDMTVSLTKLRQNECKHLCIENVAAEMFYNMLEAYDRNQRPPTITVTFNHKEQQ